MQNYRQIIENHLGRKLKSDEEVHHIDGNSENNIIENLQVVTKKQHKKIHNKEIKDWEKELMKILCEESNIALKRTLEDLKQIFTHRQICIIYKKFKNKKLSKTEAEYYCRVIKKRMIVLASSDVYELSNIILNQKSNIEYWKDMYCREYNQAEKLSLECERLQKIDKL